MKELIEFVAKKLVAHPDEVAIEQIEVEYEAGARGVEAEDDGEGEGDGEAAIAPGGIVQQFNLRVNPEDMGRVIGKGGRTAKALRTVLGTAAAKANIDVALEIVE